MSYTSSVFFLLILLLAPLHAVHAAFVVQSPISSLKSGLTGHWTFDHNDTAWSSGVVRDRSGNSNHGSMQGSILSSAAVAGRINQALTLDGSNDCISLPVNSNTTLQNVSQLSLSAWVRSSTLADQGIYTASQEGTTGVVSLWLYLSSGKIYLRGTVDPQVNNWLQGTKEVTPNKWHHVVMTYQKGGTLNLYLDGESSGSKNMSSGNWAHTSNAVRIGAYRDTVFPLNGVIDDMRTYNKVLSAAEIKNLYRQKTPFRQNASFSPGSLASSLVGHWTMDGKNVNWGTGVVRDSSPSSNNAQARGAIATSSAPVIGKIGQGLKLDASDDYLDLGNAALLTAGNPFTISWWEKITSDTGAFPSRFNLDMAGTTNYFNVTRVQSDANYGVLSWGVSPNTSQSIKTATAPTIGAKVGTWVHWVITGTNPNSTTPGDYTVYANGTSYDTAQGETFATITTNRIGHDGTNNASNATLDDIRIYTRALSASEIKTLYQMGR